MQTELIKDPNWVHPFEKAGLGKAPFTFTGLQRVTFQAAPGAPVQVGGSCDYCATGIVLHFFIRSSDGKSFKVGCDCVAKTGDRGLIKATKQGKKELLATEKNVRQEASRAQRRKDTQAARAERALVSVEAQKEILAQLYTIGNIDPTTDQPTATNGTWAERTARDLSDKIRNGIILSDPQRGLVDRMWEEHQARGRMCHLGKPKQRLELDAILVKVTGTPIDRGWRSSTRFTWNFRDLDGNILVWFTESLGALHKPENHGGKIQVKIKGTVKSHGEWDGKPQTILDRVKITWPEGWDQSWDDRWKREERERHEAWAAQDQNQVAS
jgi:hypothetical protein